MKIENSIVKKNQDASVVTYESNGTTVSLSPAMIRKYLVNGNGAVTDQEVMMFLGMCHAQKLNPFNREAYLIKYGQNSPATMITGKDVFLKRAQKNPKFDGFQSGVIVLNFETGQITEREGTFYLDQTEQLVGGWAKVWIKGARTPFYESVKLSEYIGRKKDGQVNDQWSKRPATMIRKVALSHALKEAFPDELGGLYSQEEMSDVSGMTLDETPVIVPQDEEPVPAYGETVFDQPVGIQMETVDPANGYRPGPVNQAAQPGPYQGEPMDPASALFS